MTKRMKFLQMGIVAGGDVVSLRDQSMFSLLLVTLKGLGFRWAN
jgi:hypothetical protein